MATWKKVVVSGSNISELFNDAGYGSLQGQGLVSSSAQINVTNAIVDANAAIAYTKLNLGGSSIVSSSTQTIANLNGSSIVSSSAQIDALFNIDGLISSSAQIAELGAGIVSASSQINVTNAIVDANAAIAYTKLDFEGSGFLSSSGQLGVNNSTITLSGSANGGVLINGVIAETFTLNQATNETISISLASGVVSASATGTNQGQIKLNGVDVDIKNLQTTSNVTFVSQSLTGTLAVAGKATFANDLTVTGDLYVQGSTTSIETTNLNVDDQFILINSGGIPADGGFVVAGAQTAFGYDQSEGRWAFDAAGATWNQTSISSDAFAAAVVTATANTASYLKAGNIFIDGSDIFIYV